MYTYVTVCYVTCLASATTLSGFNTVDKITTEEGLTDSVFKDANTAENGLKPTSLEVVKDRNVSSNLSGYNCEYLAIVHYQLLLYRNV